MHGPDVPTAWWIFWLIVGAALFCGLIWTFYRLAMWSDEATWRQFIDRQKRQGAISPERAPETTDH